MREEWLGNAMHTITKCMIQSVGSFPCELMMSTTGPIVNHLKGTPDSDAAFRHFVKKKVALH